MESVYRISKTSHEQRPQRLSHNSEFGQVETCEQAGMASGDTNLPMPGYHKLEKPIERTITISNDLPPYAADIPRKVSWWSLHSAWAMYAFLLSGSVFACGHHFYFVSLHNHTPDVDQSSKVGYGTLLAFLTSFCLVSAASTAFRQRTWNTVRSKRLSLYDIDSLFAFAEGPGAVLNWRVIRVAKVATLVATYTW